jgi:MFS superfamily sulfate permease-like transporter
LGYRFDFEKRKVTKTGGIFVRASPKEVRVLIDGKIKKKTDPIWGSLLIENLLPKKYKIRIEKKGYFPWEKELEVEEERVTQIKNLVLFPNNLNFYQILNNVEKFWILPNQKDLILKETEDGKWVLKAYSLDKKLKSYLVSQDDFPGGAEFFDLDFDENLEQLEIEVKIKENIKNFILDLKKSPPQLKEREEEKVPEGAICFKRIGKNFYFFEKSGYLFKEEERISNEKLEGIENCQLKIFDDIVFLESGGNLFFLNEGKFEKIFENLKGVEILPNSKKLAIFSDHEIWIFENKKIEFLNRFSEKIEKLNWVNEDYLIFLSQNKIKISETDKRDKINVYDLADFSGENFSFNFKNKRIYFQRENSIFESDPLLR